MATPTDEPRQMIIQTRYRDIPASEISPNCAVIGESQWAKLRGQPVSFIAELDETPPLFPNQMTCVQPKFRCADSSQWICGCFAEIGD